MANQTCRKPRMLFVDDEASICISLPRVLAKFGFDITSVGSVDNALAEIKAEKFDILLSDLNLPEPNAGFAIIKAMRKAQPRCINFILTGYPADEPSVERTPKALPITSRSLSRSTKWLKRSKGNWPLRICIAGRPFRLSEEGIGFEGLSRTFLTGAILRFARLGEYLRIQHGNRPAAHDPAFRSRAVLLLWAEPRNMLTEPF